ncbi:MAG: amidohydrolase family protein [Candidatus Eisenbacteria bacterium]
MRRVAALSLLLGVCAGISGTVAGKEADSWDVESPGVPADTLSFTAEEGTWISIDVHPSGDRIVFDLMGDIYTLPIEGGDAAPISRGLSHETQPRWSPDGTRIAFTSDRGGGDNIWTMNADGTGREALTKETFRLLNSPTWHPSGEYVVARKHFTSYRSLGAGEMWMYRVPGGGGGVQLTERKNDQQDAGEPVFSPDGRYLYWSEDMSGGSSFQYNKDPNGTIYVIRRLELETGEVRNLIRVPGGAVRPTPSPDGKSIAFVRRERAKSVLELFDIATGSIRPLWDGLSRDQQETWAIFGVYPAFDWTPDGTSIVLWARGKIWRLDVATGEAEMIPFRAPVRQPVLETLRFAQDLGGDTFPVRVIRWPQLAPDGKSVVFEALGKLYMRKVVRSVPRNTEGDGVRPTEGDSVSAVKGDGVGPAEGRVAILGPVVRLTKQESELELAPAISRDGRTVIYTTWDDVTGGRVRSVPIGGGKSVELVSRPGHYASARLSNDGRRLVVERVGGDGYRGFVWDEEPGVYLYDLPKRDAAATNGRLVTREGTKPRFSRDGTRLFLQSGEGEKSALVSVDLLGSDRRVHATSTYAQDFALSPDENWLAFEELWKTYVVPFPLSARSIDVSPSMNSLPVRALGGPAGTYLTWSEDGTRVRWSLGPELHEQAVAELYVETPENAEGGASSDDESDDESDWRDRAGLTSFSLGWDEPVDVPNTDLYLVGGRVLPMTSNDELVIEDGVVHVLGGRIAAVGTRAEVPVPVSATVIDVAGTTVLPGLIDAHAHTGSSNSGIHAEQNWAFLANLAFGVTTTHDPSNDTQMIFGSAERVRSGRLLGPRIFSTGTILYGADGGFKTVIDSYQDAKDALERTRAWGAFSVKSYNQPRREQRQMVVKAGHELGMLVVPEGGSTFHHNLTHLIDGHTTLEHSIPIAPLYDPELRLLAHGTAYTPTLIVGYGGNWGENYWYQETNVWENERLLQFVPRSVVDPRSRRRTLVPDEELYHFELAKTAAENVRRGGLTEIGAHGQLQGLGVHWELWMFEQGGMTPYQALRAATWMGAKALGLDGAVGSLGPGMLADLIVVEGDLLADLRRSENVRYTMVGGRLYDARTLAEIAPRARELPAGPPLDGVPSDALGRLCNCH